MSTCTAACVIPLVIVTPIHYVASGNRDFEALNSDLTFSPGNRRVCSNITIFNDVVYEDPENFEVTLSTTDPSVSVDPNRQTGEATIFDNDGKK